MSMASREPKPNPSIPTMNFKMPLVRLSKIMISQNKTVKLILYDSYIKVIENSIGSKLFRNLFAKVNGKKKDILKNGELSCAFYASSILYLFKLISNVHATVRGTVADLELSGWVKTDKPRKGAVLVWEAEKFNHKTHKHIGFYAGENKAISNNYKKGWPISHHWTFGTKNGQPVRKIEKILWHPKLSPVTRSSIYSASRKS